MSINKSEPIALFGEYVSIDELVSRTPGLIAQIPGFLMCQRQQYACVFVNKYYDFTYVHLLRCQTGDEAVEEKEAFGSHTESHGVDIKHYNADNVIFRSAQQMNP